MGFAWVLIPIVAIIAGAWSEWLKFKAKQTQLGSSTTEMERALEKMTEQNANLIRRVQNLEAIVTSSTWDDEHADRTADHRRLEMDLGETTTNFDSTSDEVARIAKRTRS